MHGALVDLDVAAHASNGGGVSEPPVPREKGSDRASSADSDGASFPANERLRVLFEHMSEAFLALDSSGRVLECNARAVALLDVEPERLRGQEPWGAVPELVGRTLHERLLAALENRQPSRFLASLPPRTWLEVSVVPVRDELWVFASDITQREEAQAQVAQAEERFRLMGERFQVALDSAQMAVWETNLVTGQVFRSEGHDRLYGYPEPLPEWTHEKFMASLHPEDRPSVEAQVSLIYRQGREGLHLHLPHPMAGWLLALAHQPRARAARCGGAAPGGARRHPRHHPVEGGGAGAAGGCAHSRRLPVARQSRAQGAALRPVAADAVPAAPGGFGCHHAAVRPQGAVAAGVHGSHAAAAGRAAGQPAGRQPHPARQAGLPLRHRGPVRGGVRAGGAHRGPGAAWRAWSSPRISTRRWWGASIGCGSSRY